MKNHLRTYWSLFLVASITLGLAPYKSPHIIGKLKWIAGGNAFSGSHAMQAQDWFDVLLHGSPWVLFMISSYLKISDYISKK